MQNAKCKIILDKLRNLMNLRSLRSRKQSLNSISSLFSLNSFSWVLFLMSVAVGVSNGQQRLLAASNEFLRTTLLAVTGR